MRGCIHLSILSGLMLLAGDHVSSFRIECRRCPVFLPGFRDLESFCSRSVVGSKIGIGVSFPARRCAEKVNIPVMSLFRICSNVAAHETRGCQCRDDVDCVFANIKSRKSILIRLRKNFAAADDDVAFCGGSTIRAELTASSYTFASIPI